MHSANNANDLPGSIALDGQEAEPGSHHPLAFDYNPRRRGTRGTDIVGTVANDIRPQGYLERLVAGQVGR